MRTNMRTMRLAMFLLSAALTASAAGVESVIEEIGREALAPNSEQGHPLPLLGSWDPSYQWNPGTAGFSPNWQMDMLDRGRHLLPWFHMPEPEMLCQTQQCIDDGSLLWLAYYEAGMRRAALQKLPVSFVGTQWEHYLTDDPAYFALPPEANPNVITPDGVTLPKISPFGGMAAWYEVGRCWGASPMMQQLQLWYPNPPLVIFVSNNEAVRLSWKDVETDARYLKLYGTGRDDNFKQHVVAEAWIARYRELQRGLRSALASSAWQQSARFFAYEAFGPGWFGRWDGWKEYSLYEPGRIDPSPLMWDGGTPSYYVDRLSGNNDYTVFSPQFDAMNWEFIRQEALALNPEFWFEISTWDGDSKQRQYLASIGQQYTPERYGGFVQFAMWLLRPRLVREYRDYAMPRSDIEPWISPLMDAVDRVYTVRPLRSFWRDSTLVAAPVRKHPYQEDIPKEYSEVQRMFLLSTSLDPAEPWSLGTKLPVFAIARVRGEAPNRSWLLYAHSPLGPQPDVRISIPEFGNVTADVAVGGSFFLVKEADKSVTPIVW